MGSSLSIYHYVCRVLRKGGRDKWFEMSRNENMASNKEMCEHTCIYVFTYRVFQRNCIFSETYQYSASPPWPAMGWDWSVAEILSLGKINRQEFFENFAHIGVRVH